MEALRYRSVPDYYSNGDLGDSTKFTNWWKTGNDVFLQGGFYIWALAAITQLLSLFDMAVMANYYVWEWGVLMTFGILNAVYGVMSWISYDNAYRELKKKDSVTNSKTKIIAKALQADIMREWNSYAIEDIISAFTLTPLLPYWYVAMGMCEGETPHWNCPEDWDDTKEEWFPEEHHEGEHHDEDDHEHEDEDEEELSEGEEE